ncbi:mannose-1-phosphate guanylyltransferase/mannose-6-phosphate isomerase [Motilimonas sp. 1_MG-2023]|uniref:mannose-1-phosphate guanylyltransferase/mannose-6-phosphate isomerase n=1 Tax=Motilimonas sp. 1_MG-2023 TaxID=3062672 RepID=UPI0026E19ECF|nr:mannose-1-phosphate guanylyltransferase/mannose-6-phosphate isomerase [Motilimonas sp. 1_MG-2023]MDO6528152.1 mannose-1-phosphate guanylyltransferase/mannose-6-phosphate isomerase [Motilimonas sp. 1_MG-2023]
MLLPVIMAGGSGTRLWPLSRKLHPKQFLSLYGQATMLQATARRLVSIQHQPPLIICNEEHRFTVAEQMRQTDLSHSGILLEPEAKNTAPALALAAFQALAQHPDEDPLLLVLAADHVVKDEQAFCNAVNVAMAAAQADHLVTFGIVPDHPEIGYGYIKRGKAVQFPDATGDIFQVAQFVEKPDLATAKEYVSTGHYSWNSGIFLFKASVFLAELKQHSPDIYHACQAATREFNPDLDFIRIDAAAFATSPEDSIDYAVMEKTSQAVVIPMDCGWSDVGGWSALWEVSDKDEQGNVFRGDVLDIDSHNSYVYAQDTLVASIGLKDIIVVKTKDAVLVADKSRVQEVKHLVEQLKAAQRSEVLHHRDVQRPWGKYDSIDTGNRFQVKHITVKPGAKLSVQMHHHRAEHWVVVSGTAKVTNGERTFLLSENESTYIPIGTTHALENPGKVPLELIEVQSGSYLGEDDIVRFEDRYGRTES